MNKIVTTPLEIPIGSIEIGEIYNVFEQRWIKVSIKCIRETTKQEFINFCTQQEAAPIYHDQLINNRFYEFQILD